MADEEEKKNGEYEKPQSRTVSGDELEDISGGVGETLSSCEKGGGYMMPCTLSFRAKMS